MKISIETLINTNLDTTTTFTCTQPTRIDFEDVYASRYSHITHCTKGREFGLNNRLDDKIWKEWIGEHWKAVWLRREIDL